MIVVQIALNAPLNLTVYSESDCPDCMNFYVSQVAPVLKTNLKSLLNIEIFSYGKAKTSGSEVTCQNGENECVGGRYQNCAKKYLNSAAELLDYVVCTSIANQANAPHNDWSTLSASCLADPVAKSVETCATSSEGLDLLIDAGQRTPKVDHVPYIETDGSYDKVMEDMAINDLKSLLCDVNPGADGCASLSYLSDVDFRINHLGLLYSETGGEMLEGSKADNADYGKSPCNAGELLVQISGVRGSVCSPPCVNSKCNNQVPANTSAAQMCALQDPSGKQYCVLVCSGLATGTCPSGASCQKTGGVGLCLY